MGIKYGACNQYSTIYLTFILTPAQSYIFFTHLDLPLSLVELGQVRRGRPLLAGRDKEICFFGKVYNSVSRFKKA